MRLLVTSLLVLALVGACASSREAAPDSDASAEAAAPVTEDSPTAAIIGDWSYSLDTPQGVYTGTLNVAESDEGLAVGISLDDAGSEESSPGTEVAFDAEAGKLTFTFDTGEYGLADVTLTLTDQALSGEFFLRQFAAGMPMTAARTQE